jgi:hypothetical protein
MSVLPCINELTQTDSSQLDIIFALAHEQGKSPVKVSVEGDIPQAGSEEADRVLGRSDTKVETGGEKAGLGKRISRRMSRRSDVTGAQNA